MGDVMISRLSSRASAVEDLVRDAEPWQKDHEDALFAGEAEDWVAAFNEEVGTALILVRNLLRRLRDNRLSQIERAGAAVDRLLMTTTIFGVVMAAVLEEVHRLGHTIDGEDRFHSTREDLKRTCERVQRSWPRIDLERFEAAHAALKAGRCLDVEDCIRELQGQGPA